MQLYPPYFKFLSYLTLKSPRHCNIKSLIYKERVRRRKQKKREDTHQNAMYRLLTGIDDANVRCGQRPKGIGVEGHVTIERCCQRMQELGVDITSVRVSEIDPSPLVTNYNSHHITSNSTYHLVSAASIACLHYLQPLIHVPLPLLAPHHSCP